MINLRQIIPPLSYNNFKTYDQCKRKYYYEYIKKLHWPDISTDFELGLSIHKLLDYQAKGIYSDNFLLNAREDIKASWEIIRNSDILKYKVIESEWAFAVNVKNTQYWIEGRIDRLIQVDELNKYVIIDFKTGHNLPSLKHEDWQSIVYLYCTCKSMKIEPDKIEFWYYKNDTECEIRKIPYSKELYRIQEDKISNKINEIINNQIWDTNLHCNKDHCKYNKICTKHI